jgi:capsular exopolysaccharide synthesis family protein
MQLLVEPYFQEKNQNQQQVDNQFTDSNLEIDYATQLNLMRSSQLLQKAVDLLRAEYPTIKVEEIRTSLNLTRIQEKGSKTEIETKLFQVNYTSNDPIKTQKVLKAIQKVYQDFNLAQQQQRLSEGLSFINHQLPAARESVNQAEKALEQFRENQSLIDPVKQSTAVAESLTKIEQERQDLRAQYKETQARYDTLQQQLARSSQEALTASRLSESSRYQTLLEELQKTELALAEGQTKFTEANPLLQKLIEQRQSQMTLLQQEAQRLLNRSSTQVELKSKSLLSEGQLGKTELELSSQLVEAQTTLQALNSRDLSLAQTEQQLRAELNRFPKLMAEHERLQPEVQIKRDTLQKLLEARQALGIEIARGGFKWQVVEAPQPGEKVGPKTKQDLLLAIVVGLFLGGLAAFAREALDDAVHTSDELKRRVALPLLGIIPEVPRTGSSGLLINLPFRKSDVSAPSTLQIVHWLPFRESLDLIYKHIQVFNSALSLKSLVVTSALPGEGKSTLALGLAFSAARLHQRVLLIDADLRRPTLHQQLHLSNEQGFSTLLATDTARLNPQRISLSGSDIDIMTAGPTPPDPVKLLNSQRMKELMAELEQTYDLVLLDTPPILGMVDAIQIASFCSGVVMVGRIDRAKQAELTEATTMLSHLNAIGVVANGASSSTSRYVTDVEQNSNPLFQLN